MQKIGDIVGLPAPIPDEQIETPDVPSDIQRTRREIFAPSGLATEDDLSYLAREFVQCSFPYKSPGNIEQWERKVNGLHLVIKRGHEDYGIPYGTLARLGVVWLCTQIVEHPTQDRFVLGHSLAEMLRAVGFNESTARGSSKRKSYLTALRDLFACHITFTNAKGGSGLKADIGKAWDLWGDDERPEQGNLFESWVKPSQDFREHVLKSHIPVPVWVISNHVKSPMELDIVFMLSHRIHMLNNRSELRGELFITTDSLKRQFGHEYARHRDFRREFSRALTNIQTLSWPELSYHFTEQGLTLQASPQLVKSRQKDKDAHIRKYRKALRPATMETIQLVLKTREFDQKTREKAEMLLRGLSYTMAVEAFWGWVDEKKIEIHDPRSLFHEFCISHRKRNRR